MIYFNSISFMPNAIAISLLMGVDTCIVVDSGHRNTFVAPVINYDIDPKCICHRGIGGLHLSKLLLECLKIKGMADEVMHNHLGGIHFWYPKIRIQLFTDFTLGGIHFWYPKIRIQLFTDFTLGGIHFWYQKIRIQLFTDFTLGGIHFWYPKIRIQLFTDFTALFLNLDYRGNSNILLCRSVDIEFLNFKNIEWRHFENLWVTAILATLHHSYLR